MTTQQDAQKILQLLQSAEGVNRALGRKLLHSQKAAAAVTQEMISQIGGEFYVNHTQNHILYYFTGKLLYENQKRILNKVEEELSNEEMLQKFPKASAYMTTSSFKRKIFNVLTEVVNMRRGISFAQLATHNEEDLLQNVRLLVTVQPTQWVIYFKNTAELVDVERLIAELAYLNTTINDRHRIKQVYRDAIKRNIAEGDSRPRMLAYVDLLVKVREPLQLFLLPPDDPDTRGYVLKITIKLKGSFL